MYNFFKNHKNCKIKIKNIIIEHGSYFHSPTLKMQLFYHNEAKNSHQVLLRLASFTKEFNHNTEQIKQIESSIFQNGILIWGIEFLVGGLRDYM